MFKTGDRVVFRLFGFRAGEAGTLEEHSVAFEDGWNFCGDDDPNPIVVFESEISLLA